MGMPVDRRILSTAKCPPEPLPQDPYINGAPDRLTKASISGSVSAAYLALATSTFPPWAIRARATKSRSGLYLRSLNKAGAMACVALIPSSSVNPSGALRATCALPSVPVAPGTLSTITVALSSRPSSRAIRRPITSVPPPAGNGTTMRIALPLVLDARASNGAAVRAAAPVSKVRRLSIEVHEFFISPSPFKLLRNSPWHLPLLHHPPSPSTD